ncbi:MAG TPA: amino acid adenylation domain-containing protein, partial [Pyrinomonadaceae bacterium]|nr:amino acid adenylation domain-containing protein [Pyrinomonadaceae bacterium]
FDLSAGPLVRVGLLRLSEEEHICLLTMHHIVSDGWSVGVLIKEVAALYEAYAKGEESPLAELPVQYADYAVWQREYLRGEVLDNQLAYWRQQLAGAAAALELPTDRPRPAVQSNDGARERFSLSPDLSRRLRELSRAEGVTLHMTLLAGWQALLSRYSNQEDVSVGTPVANRQRGETEGLVGFFVNTLVMRGDLSGEPSFRELLRRTRETCLGAYAHQEVPFERLVEELLEERDLSRTPLFQVAFVLQNVPVDELELRGLRLGIVEAEDATAKFDLLLAMSEGEGGLSGALEYRTDLFDAPTMRRMLGHFENLLAAATATPEQPVSRLPLLGEAERAELLTRWNETGRDFKQQTCLHELVEAQAAREPEAVAVTFEGERLSYAELNRRANRLAHRLREMGIGPDVLVGVLMERSAGLAAALLGVLKAGGAYVPLDPSYPAERLLMMIEDARVRVLVTERELLEKVAPEGVQTLCLDDNWQAVACESTENPAVVNSSENLAYVIYTSGSTGKPKGVMVTHSNVTRLFAATQSDFGFDGRDVWTLFHSYAFDFSVWEIWGALCHGGRLVIVPYLVSRSPEAFFELLCDEGVTVLNQTPSAFGQLMRAEEQAAEHARRLSLRAVIFGGEALELQSLRPWVERHGDEWPRLVNMYGITETTVHVTYRRLTSADVSSASGSLIGGAIPDLRVYVLDSHSQPTPVGVPGELHIGGDGLARGYLNQPALTAERFVPDPFAAKGGERLYRSGDLGRYLPTGEIEYLGRIDQQVKVRGFRIELGEIEALLAQHPSVRRGVVMAREGAGGDKQLVAYLVSGDAQPPTAADLRIYLKERLPEYMVPSFFVPLDELPLTVNGKVDRKRLPEPARTEEAGERARARTAAEEMVANVFGRVLGLEGVGVEESFFELGGHSLLATQVMSRVREAFRVELPLRTLFEHPNARDLARQVEQAVSREQGIQAPPVTRAPRDGALPLSFAQQRLWFIDQLEPGSISYNVPAAVRLTGALDVTALERTLTEIVRRH